MDILDNIKKRNKRPFTVPEGYFSTIEDSVKDKISETSGRGVNPFLSALRSSMALVVSFLMIFGVGYGVMYLTNTNIGESYSAETDNLATLIRAGYLKHDFIDYLYDEIEFDENYGRENIVLYEELSNKIENNIPEAELIRIIEKYETGENE